MLILGHRGTVGGAVSQNSLRAFAIALDAADGFETDACLSADGEVFLIHESAEGLGIGEHLDAASAGRIEGKRLRELTAADIGALRLQDGQSIPRLRDALRLVGARPGKIINIELKGFGSAVPVMALLRESFAAGSLRPEAVIISSFHHDALKLTREALPQLKIGALAVSGDEQGKPLYPHDPEPEAKAARYVDLPHALQSPFLRDAVKPDYFVMPEKLLLPETVRQVAAVFPQAKLCGWTVSERADYDQADLLKRLGSIEADKIGAIIADDPGGFAKACKL